MSDQFVAEIRLVAFTFAPLGWAFCNGQLLPISQNTALFSLLGTYYGGDGKSTFALPDLQGATALGQNPGGTNPLTPNFLGDSGGTETVTLSTMGIPNHSHPVNAINAPGTTNSPAGATFAIPRFGRGTESVYAAAAGPNTLAPQAFSFTGGNAPHNNMQPYLTLNYVIALNGIFPPRG
ncbi:phage tail protein [Leifsonia poae]|uniref:phage tail protein n=1 Tax=Leifsonia poae TaxID=110933 RepID=UPI001CC1039D|nr:tail fiber protein [Leifsonia poae]